MTGTDVLVVTPLAMVLSLLHFTVGLGVAPGMVPIGGGFNPSATSINRFHRAVCPSHHPLAPGPCRVPRGSWSGTARRTRAIWL